MRAARQFTSLPSGEDFLHTIASKGDSTPVRIVAGPKRQESKCVCDTVLMNISACLSGRNEILKRAVGHIERAITVHDRLWDSCQQCPVRPGAELHSFGTYTCVANLEAGTPDQLTF